MADKNMIEQNKHATVLIWTPFLAMVPRLCGAAPTFRSTISLRVNTADYTKTLRILVSKLNLRMTKNERHLKSTIYI